MNKENLLKSATELRAVKKSAGNEYADKIDVLVGKMNQTMLARQDVKKLVGNDNIGMMKDNHANHARFMSSIMVNFDPNVLVDTVLWVFNAYQNHGFHSQYWAAQLNTWLELFKEELSEETYCEVYPFYNWMQVNIPQFVIVSKDVAQLSNVGEH